MYSEKMCVYKLTCNQTNKSYIGLTEHGFKKRLMALKNRAKREKTEFQKDLHNIKDWSFDVMFIGFDRYIIKDVEFYLMQEFDSIENGYNISKGSVYISSFTPKFSFPFIKNPHDSDNMFL